MMRVLNLWFLCLSLAWCDLSVYPKFFSFQQKSQRKQIEQMRFDSIYAWRFWALANAYVRHTFLGEREQNFAGLVSFAMDRSYPLSDGELLVGMDLNGGGGSPDPQGGSIYSGYGIGGNLLFKHPSDAFFALSIKMAQVFESLDMRSLKDMMWLTDLGGGKRFWLNEGYFVEVLGSFGMGLIGDLHYRHEGTKIDTQSTWNFNLLSSFVMGRKIENSEVKISVSPIFDFYTRGEIYRQNGNDLFVQAPNPFEFDLLLSIAYNVNFFDGFDFFAYGDFNAMRLEVVAGLGFRLGFGENKTKPLKFPTLEEKPLKKTYLK